jgi:hypothetical protein
MPGWSTGFERFDAIAGDFAVSRIILRARTFFLLR